MESVDTSADAESLESTAVVNVSNDEQISKNQLKRNRRAVFLVEKRKFKKIQDKERKKAAKKAKRSNCEDNSAIRQRTNDINIYEGMTEEEKQQLRKELKEKRALEFEVSCSSRFAVIIDCDWEAHHDEQPIKSLGQQISFCYGFNRRVSNPVHLYITGMGPRLQAQLLKGHSDGWQNIVQTSQCYTELPCFSISGNSASSSSIEAAVDDSHFTNSPTRRRELVYLTSDAEETLEKLDPNCAYIIGGIVDRNRLKGITYAKAKAQVCNSDHSMQNCIYKINLIFAIIRAFGRQNCQLKSI